MGTALVLPHALQKLMLTILIIPHGVFPFTYCFTVYKGFLVVYLPSESLAVTTRVTKRNGYS